MTIAPSRTPTSPVRVRAARGARTRGPVLALALAVLTLSVAAATTIGTADLTVADVFRTHAVHLGLPVTGLPPLADSIVWNLRTPRVLLAGLVGGGLAVCGAVLQALTRNPLADPYLLGISAGASTGAVSVLVFGLGVGTAALTGGAFVGAVAAFAAALAMAGRRWTEPSRILLAGVAVGQLFAAVTSLIVVSAASPQQTRGVTFWLLGSLTMASWPSVALAAAVTTVAVGICWTATPALDAFTYGTDVAQSLGFAPAKVRAALFTTTALLAAVLVAASGAIGFVGLTVPHAARFLVGSRHRILLPTCAIIGATFLIWADTAARTVFAPQEVPVGVVTALLGVPAFALLIRRRQAPT
ncbi:iron chelate uptake ABC transporter family permease subunit [Solwaraspora sp. WMMD792]|uniref:FecCD family ABC transporter permease n=1 Tax=Solwaraspora sp. WMMD792 TaxID=3016099 RepID=UPI0024179FAD|nr:iron chelate uptake ABC transporter family permease subunit [Solwaraspora sp. WMMD792]MDG4774477.1 iron chelate uptake ABC transporter family permease subunit [Solwaraspora sp. WMMD792]